jgi:hypothetical protein
LRPDWPSVERVENGNGSSSLVLQEPSLNPDIPGQVLLFTENNGAAQTAARATVANVTAYMATAQAETEGIDRSQLPYEQRYSFLKAYEEKHGRTFVVVEFHVLQNPSGQSIESLRDRFLELLKDFSSSLGPVEHVAIERSRYYADTIAFEPHDQQRKYHATVRVGTRR